MVKSQHFVPVFYLKNFADSSCKLHVYDRVENKIFLCHPKNICKSNFLYETPWKETKRDLGKYVLCNEIEKSFCEYEGQYSTLVQKLLKICVDSKDPNALICSQEDKEGLTSLIVNLFVRNPWTMDYFEMSIIPTELNDHPISNVVRKLMEVLGLGGADSLIEYSVKNAYLLEHDEGGLVHDLKQEIGCLNFTFYYSASGQFITSSCPSCISRFSNGHAFAYLPLSPYVAVCFGKDDVSKAANNRMLFVSAEDTMAVNSIYSLYHTDRVRYFISNSDSTLQKYLLE